MPVAEIVRRTTLGRALPNTRLHEAVIELVKVNADLARLGNLLRMALADDEGETLPEGFDLNDLYEDIRDTQATLKARVREL